MTVKLIIDSGCDLPSGIIENYDISVLPGLIRKEDSRKQIQTFRDDKNENFTLALYQSNGFSTSKRIVTDVPPVEELIDLLRHATEGHDEALVQVISRGASPAAYGSLDLAIKEIKDCKIQLLDTKSAFTGQGMIALYAQNLMSRYKKVRGKDIDVATLRRKVEVFTGGIHTYIAPKSVDYIHKRARKKGVESPVNSFTALASTLLDAVPVMQFRLDERKKLSTCLGQKAAVSEIVQNLAMRIKANEITFPIINISIAAEVVDQLATYQSLIDLEKLCEDNGIKVFKSRMSNAGAVNFGPGTVAISCSATDHVYLEESVVKRRLSSA